MTVETATYTSQLSASNPPAGDSLGQADDHLRLIKSTILATWPNLTAAACTPSTTEINYVTGVTSAIQTQLTAKATLASPALTGVPTCPTGTLAVSSQVANLAVVYNALIQAAATVGTYAFAQCTGAVGFNSTTAGSTLKPVSMLSGGSQTNNGSALSGTWQCMGHIANANDSSLFLRIA